MILGLRVPTLIMYEGSLDPRAESKLLITLTCMCEYS